MKPFLAKCLGSNKLIMVEKTTALSEEKPTFVNLINKFLTKLRNN